MSDPREIDILGLLVAPMAVYLVIAVALFLLLQLPLRRLPIDQWVWNRPLAELALLVIVTALVIFVAIGP